MASQLDALLEVERTQPELITPDVADVLRQARERGIIEPFQSVTQEPPSPTFTQLAAPKPGEPERPPLIPVRQPPVGEAVAGALGTPVDTVNEALKIIGAPVTENPIGGKQFFQESGKAGQAWLQALSGQMSAEEFQNVIKETGVERGLDIASDVSAFVVALTTGKDLAQGALSAYRFAKSSLADLSPTLRTLRSSYAKMIGTTESNILKWQQGKLSDKALLNRLDKGVKLNPDEAFRSMREFGDVLAEAGIRESGRVGTIPELGAARTFLGPIITAKPGKVLMFSFGDPNVEARFQGAKGAPFPTGLQKVSAALDSLKRKATREFEHLPKTAEFSQLRFDLLKLAKQRGVAADNAVRLMRQNVESLDPNSFDIFSRKVILDDLVQEAKAGRALPFGFNPNLLEQEAQRLDSVFQSTREVQAAKEARDEMWKIVTGDNIAAMGDIGVDLSDRLSKPDYYRHQVLSKAQYNTLVKGAGKRLRTPTGRGFLKERKGTTLDINTDYLEAEFEVLSQMLHDTEMAKVIKNIETSPLNIAPRLKAEAKTQGVSDFKELIPETHGLWQPRQGNVFYMADAISANLAEELLAGGLEEGGLAPEDINQILAVGRRFREFVLPNEVIATLNDLAIDPTLNPLRRVAKRITNKWKTWQLGNPRTTFRYNFRNASGDAEALFVGNPSAFRRAPQATKELWRGLFQDGFRPDNLKDWMNRGGMQSTLQAIEIGELKQLEQFRNVMDRDIRLGDVPAKTWKGYWRTVRTATDFREAMLRYAAYLDYLKQVQSNPEGLPDNFGASIPEEITALKDPRDKAFMLSNQLLGAYDRVSVITQAARDFLLPFFSWKEVNMTRFTQLAKNATTDGKQMQLLGRKIGGAAIKTPYTAYRVGRFVIRALAMSAMLQAWNHSMYPEEEAQLSERDKNRPHIVGGRTDDGDIIWFNEVGMMGDLGEWFGVDESPRHIRSWLNGKKTLKDIAVEIAEEPPPINVLAQSVNPLLKTPAEIVFRGAAYPDVFDPRPIKNRPRHVAQSLKLGAEYDKAFGVPSKPFSDGLITSLVNVTDPRQVAYSEIFRAKKRFLKSIGKGGEGFWLTPRGDALYNFKLALRYKDKRAADRYLQEYVMLGGDPDSIEPTLKNMNPFSGLSTGERNAFVATMDEETKNRIDLAVRFWTEVLLGTEQPEIQ